MIIEFSKEKDKGAWLNDGTKLINQIKAMPMTKWSGSSKGLVEFKGNQFRLTFEIDKAHWDILYRFTKEICEYRLHEYFERKGKG